MASKSLLRAAGWFFALLLFLQQWFYIPVGAVSRITLLRTTLNPDAYSVFEINGMTVRASGRYTDDRVENIIISSCQTQAQSVILNEDGSYEAEFTVSAVNGEAKIGIILSSGAIIDYPLRLDGDGLYFPDNGLSEENRKVFEKIYDEPKTAAGYYLCASGDEEKIARTQELVKEIADSVTDGLERDYDKARALAQYVAENISYDHDARDEGINEQIISIEYVLKEKRTVCTGFANLYCALLQSQGIDAINIKGGSTGGEATYETLTDGLQNHEFTAFFFEEENRWVWVDSCWNGSGNYMNGEFIGGRLHEKYFDITDEALAFNHRADYARRRDFFGAEASEQAAAPEITAEEENSGGQTENSREAVPQKEKTELSRTPMIAAGLLSAGIFALLIFIFYGRKTKKW